MEQGIDSLSLNPGHRGADLDQFVEKEIMSGIAEGINAEPQLTLRPFISECK